MDAACRVQNETVWPDCPADFARGEKSAESGRGNCEKYHRGDAAELFQHERRKKSLDAGNLGNVPAPLSRSNFQIPISNFQTKFNSPAYGQN